MKFVTNREKGNSGLGIAIAYFSTNGYTVSIPLNDTQDYDFSYSLNNEEDKTISDDGIITVNVRNNKGFSLPSTGGAGTYLFTIGGIVIMAGAAFALIAMKKRA